MKNEYVNAEIEALESDMQKAKYKPEKSYKRLYILTAVLVILSCLVSLDSAEATDQQIGRWMPDTWTCSNPTCRYQNYEGINYCALCGTPKPKSKR